MKRRPSKSAAVKAPAASPATNPLVTEVDQLAQLLHRHQLSALEIERDGVTIRLRRGGEIAATSAAPATTFVPPPATVIAAPAPIAPLPTAETSDGNVSYITSPFVGTFYRAPNPDSAPFVDVGTRIHKGQILCIVEAMKLMNEIEAEVDGVVVQCLVQSGAPVEYGEPLFKIKQS